MMTDAEILEKLRRTYVDGVREWDADPDAFSAAVNQRIGCLSIELTRVAGSTVSARSPRGDVHYYSFEIAINVRPDRFRVSVEDVEIADGEAIYLVVYCASIIPLAEIRWHVITLDSQGKQDRASFDISDEKWLSSHPKEADFAIEVLDAIAHCGWQVLEPALAEQPAPAEWPWPLPTYDYQDGEYKVRDYILKGMRDY